MGADERDREDGVFEDVAPGDGKESQEGGRVGFSRWEERGEDSEGGGVGEGRRGGTRVREEEREGERGERRDDGVGLGWLESEDGWSRYGDGDGHRHGMHEIGDSKGLGRAPVVGFEVDGQLLLINGHQLVHGP